MTPVMTPGAQRVADEIARVVRYPGFLPLGNPLRFDVWRIRKRHGWACPQGLLPDNHGHHYGHWAPSGFLLFGKDGDEFASFWDAQEDPRQACLAVWGEKVYGEGFVTRDGKGRLDPKWRRNS